MANRVWFVGLVLGSLGCGAVDDPGLGGSQQALAPTGSNSKLVEASFKPEWYPGERVRVSFTLQNSGTADWTASDPTFALASLDRAWDWSYTATPVTVPAGSSHDFDFVVGAPAAAGAYQFVARMRSLGLGDFGETITLPATVTPSATPEWGCEYVASASNVPAQLAPNENRAVVVTVRNVGQRTWQPGFYLKSEDSPAGLWHQTSLLLGEAVGAGASKTWNFGIRAPGTPGAYRFRREMLDGTVGGVGEFRRQNYCVDLAIVVAGSTPLDSNIVSREFHASVAQGEAFSETITLSNTGTETWDADGSYVLSSLSSPVSLWARTSVPVTAVTAPGASTSLKLPLRAPATPGSYEQAWQLRKLSGTNAGYFGATASATVVVDAAITPPLNAKTVTQNFPPIMAAGETKSVTVTMQNTGTLAWKNDGTFSLSSTSTPVSLWGVTLRGVANEVTPNGMASFTLAVRAPAAPGTYHHLWRMRKIAGENPGVFGELIDVPVEVKANVLPEFGARVLAQDIPLRMTAGYRYSFSITMQNTGTASWAGSDISLNSTNAPAGAWGITNSALAAGETVAPGQSRTFNLPVLAPDRPGSYSSSWRMRASSVGRFGDTASTPEIVVFSPSTLRFDAAVASNTLPTRLISGRAYSVAVTMMNTGMYDWSGSDFDLFATTEPPGGWGISSVPLPASDTVGIDETHTFAFSITAPLGYTGPFSMRWRMRNRGELFGEELQVPSILGGECPPGVERNACGGCSVLQDAPDNSPCGSCGKRVCSSDGESVVCDDPGFATPVQVANGVRFSCLRLASGGVRCWGNNLYGQLGDGTHTSRTAPAAPSLPGFSDVQAGWFHTCGLTTYRTVQCWGRGVVGQIGDGNLFDHTTPTTVPGLNDVTQIAVASRHTCARVGASAVYCWGYNGVGELGIDSTSYFKASPSLVSPDTLPPPITYLAAGSTHTCVIANGKVYCWGSNWDRQLGIDVPPGGPNITRAPTAPVDGLSDVTALALGEEYSCALTGDGAVYCWGGNCTFDAWGNRHCASDGVGGAAGERPGLRAGQDARTRQTGKSHFRRQLDGLRDSDR